MPRCSQEPVPLDDLVAARRSRSFWTSSAVPVGENPVSVASQPHHQRVSVNARTVHVRQHDAPDPQSCRSRRGAAASPSERDEVGVTRRAASRNG